MKLISNFSLDFGDKSDMYFDLLSEEDFDFKTKDIKILVTKEDSMLNVEIFSDSVLDLKIANSAVIRSLEIIDKTLNV